MIRAAVFALCAAAALTNSASRATTVLVVQVGDAATGSFIADAQVRIPSVARTGRTRWDGEAHFGGLGSGRYHIQVRAIGYAPGDIDMQVEGDSASVLFNLERLPPSLDTVKVLSDKPARGLKEFEERRRAGIGRFFTDSILNEHRAQGLRLMLASRVPGLKVRGRGVAYGEGGCKVLFFLDGFELSQAPRGTRAADAPIDLDRFPPSQVAGVEVYSVATAPAQYRPLGSYCAVVLLWTKW